MNTPSVAPKVVNRKHPIGSKGIQSSLEEVAKKVREGRNNVKVRELVIKIIHDAGGPKREKAKTQAILDAHHLGYSYVSDPIHTEFMQGAALSWCADDSGVCFKGGDCDDAVIKVAAATLAAGIPTKIVGQAFDGDNGVPSHVILAIKDGNDWLRVDPSAKGFKVGDYAKAEKEVWIDPLEELTQMDFVGVGRVREHDFVGVGAPPNDPASPAVINDARRAAVTSSMSQAVYSLRSSVIDLVASLDNLVATRRTLGLPEFDPSPPNEKVAGPADFTPGKWTVGMSVYMQGLVFFSKTVLDVGDEGLNGSRRLLLDASGAAADIYIEKLSGDTRRYMPAMLHGQSAVVVTDASNNVLSVIASNGQIYSQANGNIPSLPPGTLGLGPLVVLAIVAGAVVSIAITAVTVYFVTAEICDAMKVQAQERTQQKIVEAVVTKAITIADAQALTDQAIQSRAAAAKAQVDKNNSNPFTQAIKAGGNAIAATGNAATNLVIALAVGALALGGLYVYASSKSLVRVHPHRAA